MLSPGTVFSIHLNHSLRFFRIYLSLDVSLLGLNYHQHFAATADIFLSFSGKYLFSFFFFLKYDGAMNSSQ
jgi:hypothetical protein